MTISLSFLGILLLVLMSGLWVGIALIVTAFLMLFLLTDGPSITILAQSTWSTLDSWALVSLPLFILMGEIMVRTGIAQRIFSALEPLVTRLPGGLLHTNVFASTLFAAVSGSSAATAATIGRITIPELNRRGYPKHLILGSLGGAGTLGFLIPPSLIMIIYGVLANVSIGKLFLCGLIPGALLAAFFSLYLALSHRSGGEKGAMPTLSVCIRSLVQLLPVFMIIAAVVGSIYSGIATPTESAVLGVIGTLIVGWLNGDVDLTKIKEASEAAVATTSMLGLILMGAAFLSTAMGYLQIPQQLAQVMAQWELDPLQLIACMTLMYLFLGMFLDGISMMVITLPITLPMVVAAGWDPIWFGIYLVLMIEAAQITPPIGFNLFVLKSVSHEPIETIARASVPFFLIILGFTLILCLVPTIATIFA